MGEAVFKAKRYAENKYHEATDMTSDIMEKLDELYANGKRSELNLMVFGDYIKDHVNRDIEVQHISYKDHTRKSEWDTGWISTGEDIPIFEELVPEDKIGKHDRFENTCKLLIEKILDMGFDTYNGDFDIEEKPDNGMVYLVCQNTFIGIWARQMYYDTEEFRVKYIHWYSEVEDEED